MAEQARCIAGRYELAARLGEGGMGVVWRARDTKLGRVVAVKLLSQDTVGNETARARLIREARAAAALEHPSIVRVYDVGETDDGGAFLVMELIRGQSLRALLHQDWLALGRRVEVIVEAARALEFAHDAGIVHRDVKPDNLIVRDDGRVVVVDFGVAKPVETALVTDGETLAALPGKSLTLGGQLVGTPAYLAPEQARGGEVTAAADQFALAVTAYEALAGRVPWRGTGVADLVASVLRDEPEPISTCSHLPPAFDAVIARALAKDPAARWPSMNAFADALEAAAESLPSELRGTKPSGRSTTRGTTSQPLDVVSKSGAAPSTHGGHAAATPAPAHPAPVARRLAFGLVTAAVVVGVSAWQLTRARDSSQSKSPGTLDASAPSSASQALYACPPFEVEGLAETWLGTAAAAIACERLTLVHGGGDARALVPGDLWDAPHVLSGESTASPWLEVDARARAVGAAEARASRWIDGKLQRIRARYEVTLTVRDAQGRKIGAGEGQGVELFEAVRAAMQSMVDPPTQADLASMREQLDVDSAEDALALDDVRTAIVIEDLVSLKEACDALEAHPNLLPRVRYLAQAMCARKLRTGALGTPPALDESTPAALITTSLAQGATGGPDAVRARVAKLVESRDRARSPESRARLSAAAAEVANFIGDPRTQELARAAIDASPKAFDWRTSSWHRLSFSSQGDDAFHELAAVWNAWEPISRRGVASLHDAGPMSGTLLGWFLLSQRGFYAQVYGLALIDEGKVEAARGIAEMGSDDTLRVAALLGEAKYQEALTMAQHVLSTLPADDEHAASAFGVTRAGVAAAMTLGRPTEFVDGVVSRYVTSDPPHVIDGVVPFVSLVSSCCFAPRPTAKKCIDRLTQLREDGKLPTIFNGSDKVVLGASRYVAEDYAGAAKAWRTLLRAPGWLQAPIRDPMAIAFDRSGSPELGSEVDAPSTDLVDLPRTADLAWVREAHRAEMLGDTARARKLALAVLDKWRFADEDIPATRDMKALLAKLR